MLLEFTWGTAKDLLALGQLDPALLTDATILEVILSMRAFSPFLSLCISDSQINKIFLKMVMNMSDKIHLMVTGLSYKGWLTFHYSELLLLGSVPCVKTGVGTLNVSTHLILTTTLQHS